MVQVTVKRIEQPKRPATRVTVNVIEQPARKPYMVAFEKLETGKPGQVKSRPRKSVAERC